MTMMRRIELRFLLPPRHAVVIHLKLPVTAHPCPRTSLFFA